MKFHGITRQAGMQKIAIAEEAGPQRQCPLTSLSRPALTALLVSTDLPMLSHLDVAAANLGDAFEAAGGAVDVVGLFEAAAQVVEAVD